MGINRIERPKTTLEQIAEGVGVAKNVFGIAADTANLDKFIRERKTDVDKRDPNSQLSNTYRESINSILDSYGDSEVAKQTGAPTPEGPPAAPVKGLIPKVPLPGTVAPTLPGETMPIAPPGNRSPAGFRSPLGTGGPGLLSSSIGDALGLQVASRGGGGVHSPLLSALNGDESSPPAAVQVPYRNALHLEKAMKQYKEHINRKDENGNYTTSYEDMASSFPQMGDFIKRVVETNLALTKNDAFATGIATKLAETTRNNKQKSDDYNGRTDVIGKGQSIKGDNLQMRANAQYDSVLGKTYETRLDASNRVKKLLQSAQNGSLVPSEYLAAQLAADINLLQTGHTSVSGIAHVTPNTLFGKGGQLVHFLSGDPQAALTQGDMGQMAKENNLLYSELGSQHAAKFGSWVKGQPERVRSMLNDRFNQSRSSYFGGQEGQQSPNPSPNGAAVGAKSGPRVGDVQKGYKFLGGDPSKPASWEKAQ